MKTAVQEIIEWTLVNTYIAEGQDGIKFVVVDYEQMQMKFKNWLKKEKDQIINAYNQDVYSGLNGNCEFENGKEYFKETFNKLLQYN